MPDQDGPGSNFWDFLQTFFSNPTVIKTTGTFLIAGFVLLSIMMGWLDGNILIEWFKEVWHTIKGTG